MEFLVVSSTNKTLQSEIILHGKRKNRSHISIYQHKTNIYMLIELLSCSSSSSSSTPPQIKREAKSLVSIVIHRMLGDFFSDLLGKAAFSKRDLDLDLVIKCVYIEAFFFNFPPLKQYNYSNHYNLSIFSLLRYS